MTPTIILLTTLLSASPCSAGQVRLTYAHGPKDARTTCFKARGKTLKGKRHGRWVATVKQEDGGCEVQEYYYQKVASGRYVKGFKQGKWRFEKGDRYTKRVIHITYHRGKVRR
jgi:hypothetical protein